MVSKTSVHVERNLDFFEFKRIIENVKMLHDYIDCLCDNGVEFTGRQLENPSCDMLLMLATLLDDDKNLLPYYCWSTDFGKLEEITIEDLWEELTKGSDND